MNYISAVILSVIILGGCAHIVQKNDSSKSEEQILSKNDPDMYSYEEFSVIKHCYNMVVVKIDSCHKDSGWCYGTTRNKSSYETTYTKIQNNKKVGDEFKYCYIHQKSNYDRLDEYFIYEY